MKALNCLRIALAALLLLSGCGAESQASSMHETVTVSAAPEEGAFVSEAISQPEAPEDKEEQMEMKLQIGDTPVTVSWEDNDAVAALRDLAARETLTIPLSMYGGFEQVGAIGHSLPRADVQTTTEPGDIVLYSGNQIVLFYGSNSWAYTRLGHVTDPDGEELKTLLGQGDVSISIFVA